MLLTLGLCARLNFWLALVQVLNEEKGLANCLQYFQSLDTPPHQIVVVDGGSEDRCLPTSSLIDKLSDSQ